MYGTGVVLALEGGGKSRTFALLCVCVYVRVRVCVCLNLTVSLVIDAVRGRNLTCMRYFAI